MLPIAGKPQEVPTQNETTQKSLMMSTHASSLTVTVYFSDFETRYWGPAEKRRRKSLLKLYRTVDRFRGSGDGPEEQLVKTRTFNHNNVESGLEIHRKEWKETPRKAGKVQIWAKGLYIPKGTGKPSLQKGPKAVWH